VFDLDVVITDQRNAGNERRGAAEQIAT